MTTVGMFPVTAAAGGGGTEGGGREFDIIVGIAELLTIEWEGGMLSRIYNTC